MDDQRIIHFKSFLSSSGSYSASGSHSGRSFMSSSGSHSASLSCLKAASKKALLLLHFTPSSSVSFSRRFSIFFTEDSVSNGHSGMSSRSSLKILKSQCPRTYYMSTLEPTFRGKPERGKKILYGKKNKKFLPRFQTTLKSMKWLRRTPRWVLVAAQEYIERSYSYREKSYSYACICIVTYVYIEVFCVSSSSCGMHVSSSSYDYEYVESS